MVLGWGNSCRGIVVLLHIFLLISLLDVESFVFMDVCNVTGQCHIAVDIGHVQKGKTGDQTAMTARQLLSILRLSQALARLRFSDFVAREDVDEAIRLVHMSKASLWEDVGSGRNGQEPGGRREDVMSRVFNIIRDYATTSQSSSIELKLAESMVLRKGFTIQQLQSCLEEYEALEIIQVNQSRTLIHFVT